MNLEERMRAIFLNLSTLSEMPNKSVLLDFAFTPIEHVFGTFGINLNAQERFVGATEHILGFSGQFSSEPSAEHLARGKIQDEHGKIRCIVMYFSPVLTMLLKGLNKKGASIFSSRFIWASHWL